MQADELAALVQACAHLALGDRTVEIVRLVLFPAPDELDGGPGELLRDRNGLARIVLSTAAPAEAAAQVELVHLAVGERHARLLARGRERAFGALRRGPDLDLVAFDDRGAVHRLHGRVGEERGAVDRLDLLR